jgi:hypothetical protein
MTGFDAVLRAAARLPPWLRPPATTSQMVRSLGVPAKSAEKREPTEAGACLQNLISPTPTTRKAIPTTLGMTLSVVACKQYSTDLQTRTFIGQRFVRIRHPAGQHSVQMGQHSCANGLQTHS